MRRLLDAAAIEFGEHGFAETSIVGITRRAGMALGSFYTYFPTKEAIFTALVKDMSQAVARAAGAAVPEGATGTAREAAAFAGFLAFAREHKEVYRIIDEAERADPASYRTHYEGTAERISARLQANMAEGSMRAMDSEVLAWAIMGMNVFLGLRYAVWGQDRDIADIAAAAEDLLARGTCPD